MFPDITRGFDTFFKKEHRTKGFSYSMALQTPMSLIVDTFHPLTASHINFRTAFGGIEYCCSSHRCPDQPQTGIGSAMPFVCDMK